MFYLYSELMFDVRCYILYITIIYYIIIYYTYYIIIHILIYVLFLSPLLLFLSSILPPHLLFPSPLPPLPSLPNIHSIRVGTYIYLFIFNPDLFLLPFPSPLPLHLPSLPFLILSYSPLNPHSKYTCRHLDLLINVLSISLPE